jgi:hypothetical protein
VKLTYKQLSFLGNRSKEIDKILSYKPSRGDMGLELEQRWIATLITVHNNE